jgi:acetylglutamate kinase
LGPLGAKRFVLTPVRGVRQGWQPSAVASAVGRREAVDRITVVKIGGSTLGSHDTTLDDIVALQRQDKPLLVVHGGGKLITEWLGRMGVSSTFIRGERVTDLPTLEVAIAVLAGLVNKDIVAGIESRGGQAIGIAGVDGSLIEGSVGDAAKGYVGVVSRVNANVLKVLMGAGYVPIVAPVGLNTGERPEGAPSALNFNADVVAGEIGAAVGAERLIFLTDVKGILNQAGELISDLSVAEANTLIESGVASGGMIPKIRACQRTVSASDVGCVACIVDGREQHALMQTMGQGNRGTMIHR